MNTAYHHAILPNGLRALTITMPHMESVAVGFWVGVGSRYEDEKTAGISHFFEHLVFKGSRRFSCAEIKSRIEGTGGTMNAFTGEEATCFFVKVPRKFWKNAYGVLEDMVRAPLLKSGDIEKERKVILEELKMYIDMPQYYVVDVLQELMFPAHPLGRRIIGTPQAVRALTRREFLAQQRRFYDPCAMTVVAAGALGPDEFVEALTKRNCARKNRFKNVRAPRFRTFQKGPRVAVKARPTEQLHIALGMYGFHRLSPHKYALDLVNILLGGNMSSRLFNEVREKKGLAYDIHSGVKYYYDTGAMTIEAGLDPGKVTVFIDTVCAVLKKFASQGPGVKELRKAKEYYKGQLFMELEDTMHHMLWAGEKLVSGDTVRTAAHIARQVETFSAEYLRTVAARLFTSKNCFCAIIGELKETPAYVAQRIARL